MDARVTKHRLANMLSYDWLKILVAVIFAIAALSVFFTMVRTRATEGQTFTIYGHSGVTATAHANDFDDELVANKVFSYDVLDVNVENFPSSSMSDAAFSARRAAGEGRVIFVSDYLEKSETDGTEESETEQREVSDLWAIAGYTYDSDLGRILRPSDYTREGVVGNGLEIRAFLKETEAELEKFFGSDWRAGGEPDGAVVRSVFKARNGKDNRYRFSSAKFEEGVKDEAERVKKLREDYLAVMEAFGNGTLTYVDYPVAEGEEPCAIAVGLGNLGKIKDLYTYSAENGTKTEDLCLLIFDNGKRLGDLKYEPVSLLAYLAERYA